MSKIIYPTNSAYSTTPQTSWCIGLYKHRTIPVSSDDEYDLITPEFQYRPDKLANKLYGSWRYYWVFMSRNLDVIRDPIWDFKAGTGIWIPTSATIVKATG